jgi:dynein heavy chain
MHENADITTAQNEAEELLLTILHVQPRDTSESGKSSSAILHNIAEEIQKIVGKKFELEDVFKMYPTDYNESMNTVLYQEVIKYNHLIITMINSLDALKLALAGKIVMSQDIDDMSKSLLVNRVPAIWSGVFLSLKPLSSWIEDYTMRIKFLRDWIEFGTPKIFWFPGKIIFY